MTGIYGAYNRASSLVDAESLDRMQAVYSAWFDDGSGQWLKGRAGLGFVRLKNQACQSGHDRPIQLQIQEDSYAVVFSGRLDNRDALVEMLSAESALRSQNPGHEEMVALAYREWGDNCAAHLLGEFSFAVWDPKAETLFCARDQLGIKPFYYVDLTDQFLFANDAEPLAELPQVGTGVCLTALARYFAYCQLNHAEKTFFQDIRKLPPGHCLTANSGGVNVRRYWFPENVPGRTFDRVEDYVEELGTLVKNAVHGQVDSDFPVACHLSGGLDSSLVSVLAARELASCDKPLHAFNWIHSPRSNENAADPDFSFSKRLASSEGMQHHFVDFSVRELAGSIIEHDIQYNDTALLRYEPFVRREVRRVGARTILSGWGGDEFASFAGAHYLAGRFWGGQPVSAWSELYAKWREDPGRYGVFSLLWRVIREFLLPVSPDWLYRKVTGLDANCRDHTVLLSQRLRKLLAPLMPGSDSGRHLSARDSMLHSLATGHLQTRLESWAAGGFRKGIEYRYPLLDRRVVELALAAPDRYFDIGGWRRYPFRLLASALVSEKVAWRRDTKVEPNRMRRVYFMEKALPMLWQDSLEIEGIRSSIGINDEALVELLRTLSRHDSEQRVSDFDYDINCLLTTVMARRLLGDGS